MVINNQLPATSYQHRVGMTWIESRADDFMTIRASWTDQPVPSGVSLAETGLTRYALLTGREIGEVNLKRIASIKFAG